MKIWFASSECAPFSKSGGLADVAFSLPPVLQATGDEVEIITPLYKCVWDRFHDELTFRGTYPVILRDMQINAQVYEGRRAGVPVWFIGEEQLFMRDRLYGYDDDAWRFAFFSKAIVSLLGLLSPCPDILHCNDWETAATILYLKDKQQDDPRFGGIRTVYTIHNIAYQGQYAREKMYSVFGFDSSWYERALIFNYEGREDINLMKAAMMMADAVSTVSPTYARELHHPQFGEGLQGVIDYVDGKLYGILNGIDVDQYDAMKDPRLPAPFSVDNLEGKAVCKEAVQKRFGLTPEPEWPLVAVVARLVEQKGLDLIKEALPGLMDLGVQLVVFGQGDPQYTDYFRWAAEHWPGQMGFSDRYTEAVASEIFAGADFYLMPSRFEPCGLSQMMAMRFGTVPIVRETGGLRDSVRSYSTFDGIGEGFSFSEYAAKDLYLAVLQAIKVYLSDPETFNELRLRCMRKDFSWERSAEQYRRMYHEIHVTEHFAGLTFQEAFENIRETYRQVDEHNRRNHPEWFTEGFSRIIEIEIIGEGAGWLYIKIGSDSFAVEPWSYHDADAHIKCSYYHFMRMMRGETTAPRLFMKGRLKITGNLAKGFEIKDLLSPR
jgi:starch synthase